MIDIENQVFTRVAQRLEGEFPGVYVTGTYENTPASFPTVMVQEMDNSVLARTQTTDHTENHAVVMYQVDTYATGAKGRKSQCKAIARAADDEMAKMGFTRIAMNPVPNMDDSIFRITGRYRATVSRDNVIYRR